MREPVLVIDNAIPQRVRQRLKKEYTAICPLTPDWDAFYSIIKHVSFNNRLRTSAGRAVRERCCREHWHIELNPKYYQAYGLERVVGTYLHELAHVAAHVFYGDLGHSKNFKRLCDEFGGTMNPGQGSRSPAANVTSDFLEILPKWRYSCPGCGQSFIRIRRISARKIQQAYCVKCQTPARMFLFKQLR